MIKGVFSVDARFCESDKGQRIILTSRGRPKAVLVSLDDLEKLQRSEAGQSSRAAWLANAQNLAVRIQERRGDYLIDVQALLDENRADLEYRHDE